MRIVSTAVMIALCANLYSQDTLGKPKAKLLGVRKIWDSAPHNAFTDLIRFKDQWFCVFREGQAHVSPDGALRVLSSKDGETWESAAVVASDETDLRDAKISVTPDNRLMLAGAGAYPKESDIRHQSFVWFSDDGKDWGEAVKVGDPNVWMWRIVWHKGHAYGLGYSTTSDRFVRLYKSADGRKYETLVDKLEVQGYANEAGLIFLADDTLLCVLRRDPDSGMLGASVPPYTQWNWRSLETRIGGPQIVQMPDTNFVVASRLYNPPRTSLSWLEPATDSLVEFLKFPSGGDTSYPGMVWHEDKLWVSYYSSHEGKTSIYIAQVGFSTKAEVEE